MSYLLNLTILLLLILFECKVNAGVIDKITQPTTESSTIPGGYNPSEDAQLCGNNYREVYKTICGEYPPGPMPTLERLFCCKYRKFF